MTIKSAVILAAGQGIRLRPRTLRVPKCLLVVGPKRLIDYQLDSLIGNGFRHITMVVGYKDTLIQKHVATRYPRLKIRYIKNHDYALTGPAHSLWLARRNLRHEFLLMTSDIICSAEVVKRLLGHQSATVLAASSILPRRLDAGILVGRDMKITKLGKRLTRQKNYYEFMGMMKVGRQFGKQLFYLLQTANSHRGLVVDAVAQTMLRSGKNIKAVDLAPARVLEVDTPADFRRAEFVCKN